MQKRLRASEAELFRTAVEDAKPIETGQAEPFRRRPPPTPIVQPLELNEKPERATLAEAEIETGDTCCSPARACKNACSPICSAVIWRSGWSWTCTA